MATTGVVTKIDSYGTRYVFTIEDGAVKLSRDDDGNIVQYDAFSLEVGGVKFLTVDIMENGLLEATYVSTLGAMGTKFSEDDGETWQ